MTDFEATPGECLTLGGHDSGPGQPCSRCGHQPGVRSDLRARVRQRIAEDRIPVGTDHPTLLAEGAPPLHRRVFMESPMDDVPGGAATDAVNGGRAAGDCLRAAVATVLGADLDDVPHFVQYIDHPAGTDSHLWYWSLVGFCAAHGWEVSYTTDGPPDGWALVDGMSPRGHMHVVVAYDGKVIHDPHPSGGGLISTEGWFTFQQRLPEEASDTCERNSSADSASITTPQEAPDA